ncbi:MAG: permease prefix domain 1-containing protein [Terriglobia bacterium]
MREEIEEHLALMPAEKLQAGFSAVEARRQALLNFGAVESAKENCRDLQGLPFLENLLQGTRYALRRLRRAPRHKRRG